MDSGIAISQLHQEETIQNIAHTPIHKYFLRIAQFLEHRQEVAERYLEIEENSEFVDNQFKTLIDWDNSEIMKVLNIAMNSQLK